MGDKGVGKLWWSAMTPFNDPIGYILYVGCRVDSAPGYTGVSVGGLRYGDGVLEYVHFGPEIMSVLTYEGVSVDVAKKAVEVAVSLRCNLRGAE